MLQCHIWTSPSWCEAHQLQSACLQTEMPDYNARIDVRICMNRIPHHTFYLEVSRLDTTHRTPLLMFEKNHSCAFLVAVYSDLRTTIVRIAKYLLAGTNDTSALFVHSSGGGLFETSAHVYARTSTRRNPGTDARQQPTYKWWWLVWTASLFAFVPLLALKIQLVSDGSLHMASVF